MAAKTDRQARVFDTTLSAITDFAYIFDRHARFLFVNQALLDLWGLELKDAVGKNFFELRYPEALAAKLDAQIHRVFETGERLRDETAYTSPTGVSGFYEYIFSPVHADDGSVEVVAGLTRNVTARKQMEERLQKSEDMLRRAQRAGRAGVWELDLRNNLIQIAWSDAYYELLGLERSVEPSVHAWLARIHPDDRARIAVEFQRAVHDACDQNMEFRIVHPDGRVRWMHRQGQVERDAQGRAVRVSGITFDITERRGAEEALRNQLNLVKAITDNTPSCLLMMDPNGRITFANPAAEWMTGFQPGELIDRMPHEMLHHMHLDGTPFRSRRACFTARCRVTNRCKAMRMCSSTRTVISIRCVALPGSSSKRASRSGR